MGRVDEPPEVMGGKKRNGIIARIRGRRPCAGKSDDWLIRRSLYRYRGTHGVGGVCEEWNAVSCRGASARSAVHPFVAWSIANGWRRGKCLVKVGDGPLGPRNAAWCVEAVKRCDGVEVVR